MYKYLPIATNLNEMMVMFRSLPAYTLVFDKKSELIDINKPAIEFFKFTDTNEFNARINEVFPVNDYIKTIIQELKLGKTVRYARTMIKDNEDNLAAVELCACMINGPQDLFLFQLFEISPVASEDMGSFTSYSNDNQTVAEKSPHTITWVTNPKNMAIKPKRWANRRAQAVTSGTQIKKTKYRELTHIETLINELRLVNLSIPEIASITNKAHSHVWLILHRIKEKQKLNAQNEIELENDKTNEMHQYI